MSADFANPHRSSGVPIRLPSMPAGMDFTDTGMFLRATLNADLAPNKLPAIQVLEQEIVCHEKGELDRALPALLQGMLSGKADWAGPDSSFALLVRECSETPEILRALAVVSHSDPRRLSRLMERLAEEGLTWDLTLSGGRLRAQLPADAAPLIDDLEEEILRLKNCEVDPLLAKCLEAQTSGEGRLPDELGRELARKLYGEDNLLRRLGLVCRESRRLMPLIQTLEKLGTHVPPTIDPRPPSGFPHIAYEEQIAFHRILRLSEKVCEDHGYLPVITSPVQRHSDARLSGHDDFIRVLADIPHPAEMAGGLVLPREQTGLLVAFAAQCPAEAFPLRRYECKLSYRQENPGTGRYNGFDQFNVDCLSPHEPSPYQEAASVLLASEVLAALGIKGVRFVLSNKQLLASIVDLWGVKDKRSDVLDLYERAMKFEERAFLDAFHKLVPDERGLPELLLKIRATRGSLDEVNERIEALWDDKRLKARFKECEDPLVKAFFRVNKAHMGILNESLEDRARTWAEKGDDRAHSFIFDLALSRSSGGGCDIYTKVFFETEWEQHPEVGSICSGGTYEDLAYDRTGKRLPGVGFAVGASRIFGIIRKNRDHQLFKKHSEADVLVTTSRTGSALSVQRAAYVLRDHGFKAQDCFPGATDRPKSMAEERGIPYVLFADRLTVLETASGKAYTVESLEAWCAALKQGNGGLRRE